MSDPRPVGSNAADDGSNDKQPAVAKTAGIVVFSGIAMSIIKAFFPKNNADGHSPPLPLHRSSPLPDPKESIKPSTPENLCPQTVEIVKGDTLWGFSRKYGVSIDAIKEANGMTGDKIYAGKKLVIP